MEYPLLLEPITLAGRTVRNRVVHASMSTRFTQNQEIHPRMVRYHANRAAGGVGMIVTEPLNVLPWQQRSHRPALFEPNGRDALARWAESVESKGCRLLGQFQDSGRGHREGGRSQHAWAPSALPDDLSWTMPREMPRRRIHEAIERFGKGARRLEQAGFSGVELSAGHGHLFHQFLSPAANIRDDEYGGDLEGRTRFLIEIIQIISSTCNSNFIIGLKLPADDGIPGGVDHSEAARITARLAGNGGFHYLVYCDGSHSNTLETHVPDMSYPRAPYVDGHVKIAANAPDVPLMALGLITDPAEAEGILAAGKAQMVALGRPLVTDAAWVKKAAEGRQSEIRYCVSCNTCWATIVERRPILCDNNPRLAQARRSGLLAATGKAQTARGGGGSGPCRFGDQLGGCRARSSGGYLRGIRTAGRQGLAARAAPRGRECQQCVRLPGNGRGEGGCTASLWVSSASASRTCCNASPTSWC